MDAQVHLIYRYVLLYGCTPEHYPGGIQMYFFTSYTGARYYLRFGVSDRIYAPVIYVVWAHAPSREMVYSSAADNLARLNCQPRHRSSE